MPTVTDGANLIKFRFIVREGFGERDAFLGCPICGCENVHMGPVVIMQGYTTVAVEREATHEIPRGLCGKCRGSNIRLAFYCESGHQFCYEMQFHKGITAINLIDTSKEIVGDISPDYPELWRD